MLVVKFSHAFKKDYQLMKKRGKNMNLLHEVVEKLAIHMVLPDKYQDHILLGNLKRISRMSY